MERLTKSGVRRQIVEPINGILYACEYCKTIDRQNQSDNSVVTKYVIQQRHQINKERVFIN